MTNNLKKIIGYVLVFFALALIVFVLVNRKNKFNTISVPSNSNSYNISEVSIHNTSKDCWTVISGEVYNLSSFIPNHKGGDLILLACGKDATDLFTGKTLPGRVHSRLAISLLSTMKIGEFKN